jgi:hypothetical protein
VGEITNEVRYLKEIDEETQEKCRRKEGAWENREKRQ